MIKINQLNKYFKQSHILKDISFTIKEGETVSIIGPSGSGKSTLIRCLNLLEKPQSGQIIINDLTIDAPHFPRKIVHQVRTSVGMVFQSFNLFPHLNAIQNVAEGLITVKKIAKKNALKEADIYLRKVGLGDKTDKYPSQLSGGQQQRVAIARSLAMQPKVILMDEPTSALDPELVQEVLSVIKDVSQDNMTCVIVTHELFFAKEISDSVIFLNQGELIEMAPPIELFENPKHERTRAFLSKFMGNVDYII